MIKENKVGRIIISDDANVWPHEIKAAKALVKYGYTVEFIPESQRKGKKRADCFIDNVLWEMKAPRGATLHVVERELAHQLQVIKKIDKIRFINRRGKVIDI